MRLTSCLVWAAALVASALGRPRVETRDSAVAYYDSETGFTFSEFKAAYSLTSNVVFRIAVSSAATASSPYDVVLQVVAPTQVGWAGLAWGGNMVRNPLSVGWANGNTAQFSSRWANTMTLPTAYTGATYTRLTAGNRVNSTHWQYTAKCAGCTSFTGKNGYTILNPRGSNRLAFAYASDKPSTPSSNTSSFTQHSVHNYWSHDFTQGLNTDFASLLQRNGVQPSELSQNGTA